jgi:ankyrin repeat protein
MIAVDSGSEKLVRALLLGLSGSSDEGRRTVCNQQDAMGYTALHRAVEIAHEGIVRRLVDAGAAATIPNSVSR